MSVSDFRDTRRVVAEHQGDLQKIAYLSSPSRLKPPGRAPSYLLAKPGWLLDVPIPLNEVKLLYDGGDQSNRWQRARETATALMPHLPGGRYRATYSQALVEYDGRTELFNGFSYRLLDVDINEDRVRLKFGDGHYFDYLDTGEVLAYEAAVAVSPRPPFIEVLTGEPLPVNTRGPYEHRGIQPRWSATPPER